MRWFVAALMVVAAARVPTVVVADYDDEEDEVRLVLEEMQERIAQLEARLEVSPATEEDDDDEKSLLEIFSAEVSKFILTRLLPRSDPECSFNYAKSVCVPKCRCSLQFKLGDYSLSRSCRLRPLALPQPCSSSLEHERGALVKAGEAARNAGSRLWTSTNEFLDGAAPVTDYECDWSWDSLACEPVDACDLRYKFGDYHLGRACRRRRAEDDDAPSMMMMMNKKKKKKKKKAPTARDDDDDDDDLDDDYYGYEDADVDDDDDDPYADDPPS